MSTRADDAGISIAETLVAVVLVAAATAAVLPAIAQAARLHRESELQTFAVMAAAGRLERLKTAVATGLGAGGSLETAVDGWHVWLDREGRVVDEAGAIDAVFLCTWRASPSAAANVAIAAVRVAPRGAPHAAITLSTMVRRE